LKAGAARRDGGPAVAVKRAAGRTRTLTFIAACFVASAVVRVGDMGSAMAQAPAPEPTAPPRAGPARAPTLAEQAAACGVEPGPLIEAIRERAAALEAREARLAERESLLTVAESRVREEIARLEAAESALAATLALADGASERDVAHLVGVYETMKPKDAAQVFAEMDPRLAAGFLARMRADAAAAILAAMDAPRAYAVTVIMAGRHVTPEARAVP
jgi:flagellar motility protein MotE (MotC chaperone)